MATETKMDVSFLEKLSDKLSAFSEGVVNLLGRMFGSSNERYLRKLGYIRVSGGDPPYRMQAGSILARVCALEEQMHALSPAELKELTPKFRERLKNGESLDDLLPEAFAACREAALRTKNMRHF